MDETRANDGMDETRANDGKDKSWMRGLMMAWIRHG